MSLQIILFFKRAKSAFLARMAQLTQITHSHKQKEKAVPWNSFFMELIDYNMFHDLLNWERFNYIYHHVTEAPEELWDENSRAEYDNLGETLELIEMELQSSQRKLSFLENPMSENRLC